MLLQAVFHIKRALKDALEAFLLRTQFIMHLHESVRNNYTRKLLMKCYKVGYGNTPNGSERVNIP